MKKATLDTQVNKYFQAERSEGILGTVIGVLSLILAGYFIYLDAEFYQGVGYAFIGFGFIELLVFLTVAIRTTGDIRRVSNWLDSEVSKIKSEEMPRMNKVMKNFLYYRWSEAGLLILGIFLISDLVSNSILNGVGAGLIIHSLLLLILDAFAEKRGQRYLEYLRSLENTSHS